VKDSRDHGEQDQISLEANRKCKDVLISIRKEIKKPPSQRKRPGDVGKVAELRYQTCALWFVVFIVFQI
jgi:hypothetical protein